MTIVSKRSLGRLWNRELEKLLQGILQRGVVEYYETGEVENEYYSPLFRELNRARTQWYMSESEWADEYDDVTDTQLT